MRKKKKKTFIDKLRKKLREFETIDRVYYDGKLTSLIIILLVGLILISCIILCLIF